MPDTDRHIMQFFDYEHLPRNIGHVSRMFHDLAHRLHYILADNPETSVALRKLLESKDAAVRSYVSTMKEIEAEGSEE